MESTPETKAPDAAAAAAAFETKVDTSPSPSTLSHRPGSSAPGSPDPPRRSPRSSATATAAAFAFEKATTASSILHAARRVLAMCGSVKDAKSKKDIGLADLNVSLGRIVDQLADADGSNLVVGDDPESCSAALHRGMRDVSAALDRVSSLLVDITTDKYTIGKPFKRYL